ncbi:hypothetical protein J3459_015719 [Metarhizium acridum]|nr:hypothetical protein J3459_015719 [Metarhizium acridum]
MTLTREDISKWLAAVPSSSLSQEREQYCRKRLPPTPPMSEDEASPTKRLRADPDATPTRPTLGPKYSSSYSRGSGSSTSAASRHSRNGTKSPTKRIAYLQMEQLIDYKPFGGSEAPPTALQDFVKEIKQYATGIGILSHDELEKFRDARRDDNLFRDILETKAVVDETDRREQLGKLPDVRTLIEIWNDAQECLLDGHAEASWNCSVHFPLMKVSLQLAAANSANGPCQTSDSSLRRDAQITPFNVTTAQIVAPYTTTTVSTKHDRRIDFCICISPRRKSALSSAICHVAKQSDHFSINHSDYPPLIARPIGVSFEAKLPGSDWQPAIEQLSAWMGGHWMRISELNQSADDIADLQYLPGIIIQGHDWHFIAATRGPEVKKHKRRQIIIWNKILIGSTDTMQGICQIVVVLQRLAKWCHESLLTWLLDTVLVRNETYQSDHGY